MILPEKVLRKKEAKEQAALGISVWYLKSCQEVGLRGPGPWKKLGTMH